MVKSVEKVLNFTDLGNNNLSPLLDSQVSKQPILKNLLCILGKLSSTQLINWDSVNVASHYWNLKSSGESVSFVDVCDLSDVLFTELDRSFKSMFSTLRKESCYTFASGEESIELAILY